MSIRRGLFIIGVIVLLSLFTGLATTLKEPQDQTHEQKFLLFAAPSSIFQDIIWGVSKDNHIKATFISRAGEKPDVFLRKINRYITDREFRTIDYSAITEIVREEEVAKNGYRGKSLFHYLGCTVVFDTQAVKKKPVSRTPKPRASTKQVPFTIPKEKARYMM